MPQVIQDWLGTRLGVVVDLSPEKFGRNMKDGQLLAKLLHNYGIINAEVLNKVKPAKYIEDCLYNLSIIKPWLDCLGVPNNMSTLHDIANGKGSAALSLFYALYLNLEHKGRLHFISAQKERKFSGCHEKRKIKVDWVPELEVRKTDSACEPNLVIPLIEKHQAVVWHRGKCAEVINQIKQVKEKFSKVMGKPRSLKPIKSKHSTSQPLPRGTLEEQETQRDICIFENKHVKKSLNLPYDVLLQSQKNLESAVLKPVPNFPEAVHYLNALKCRSQRGLATKTFQQKMQTLLLDDLWRRILNNQENDFNQKVFENLLKQSQYEKQMCSKLLLIKHQKKILSENRKLIEKLIMSERDKEFEDILNQKIEANEEFSEVEKFEKEKMQELHKRLYNEKVRLRFLQRWEESQNVLRSITDIAIRCADYRFEHSCQVPHYLMKDMKELFYKNLPIFDLLEDMESLFKENSEKLDDTEIEEIKSLEYLRQDVLDECDFNDYTYLLGPWMTELLWGITDTEVDHIILGYLAHKLLLVKYPKPPLPEQANIKLMFPTSVVLGLVDEKASIMLEDLLRTRKILVVRVKDAINYVMSVYKRELSVVRDIDINFDKATKGALKGKEKAKPPPSKKQELAGKGKALPVKSPEKSKEVETQTPRKIPDDDPLLSSDAELGKIAFESMGVGSPIPDSVIVPSIVAYVISMQNECDGWVLLNYPELYSQARRLESTLTGYELIPLREDSNTIEDVEGYVSRPIGRDPDIVDPYNDIRISRIVPRVCLPKEYPEAKSYFTSFIEMKKVGPAQEKASLPPLENFYFQQKVLYNFDYVAFNFQSMLELAKLILGEMKQEESSEVVPKTSIEIFGEEYTKVKEKWNPSKKGTEKSSKKPSPTIKQLTPPPKVSEPEPSPPAVIPELPKGAKPPTPVFKPGDKDWVWADAPQPLELQIAMANFWENVETIFIEDLKKVFFGLRLHHSKINLYSTFVKKFMRNFMRRPDDKQRLLCEFQHMFNEIDVDLRPDIDIKCELHLRVSEFETSLLEIADNRKKKSEAQRKRIIHENWVSDEMAGLVNHYLTALQIEANRCVDSCQLINDYYITLQQKLPEEIVLPKIVIPKIQIKDQKYSISSTSSDKSQTSTPSLRDSKSSLKRSTSTMKKSSEESFLHTAIRSVSDILIELCLPEDGLTPFHTFFTENIELANNRISSTLESLISNAKKGDKGGKGGKIDPRFDVGIQIATEWPMALEDELKRYLFRTNLILRRGLLDIDEFLTSMLNTFLVLSDEIGEIYGKEVHNISECCKLFRCSIEDEIAVQPQLEFDVDEFIIRNDVQLFPNPSPPSEPYYDEKPSNIRFTVGQLSNLYEKLYYVAPNGEIVRRAFIYILEDLRAMKSEDGLPKPLPEIWQGIKPDDISTLFDEIYQKLEIVSWKDFIIYALDLPFPTEMEILQMRKRFQECDPHLTEIISREAYNTITFWFDDDTDDSQDACRKEKAKNLLLKMFQVDDNHINYTALMLAFCKDIDPAIGFLKALAFSLGKRVIVRDTEIKESLPDHSEAEEAVAEIIEELISDSVQEVIGCIVKSIPCSAQGSLEENELREDCPPPVKKDCKCRKESVATTVSYQTFGEAGEMYSVAYPSVISEPSSAVSVIPRDVITSIILTSFPSLPQLTILLNSPNTLKDTLNSLYESLEPINEAVKTYELLQHNFMYHLLTSTNKFKSVRIASIVRDMLEDFNGEKTVDF